MPFPKLLKTLLVCQGPAFILYCLVNPGSPVAVTVILPVLFVLLHEEFCVTFKFVITGLL